MASQEHRWARVNILTSQCKLFKLPAKAKKRRTVPSRAVSVDVVGDDVLGLV